MIRRLLTMPVSSRMAAGRALTLTVEYAVTIYLMRLLGPEPYGLMAMTMAVLALAVVLQDGGAAASLVSDADYSERRAGAALAIGLTIGLSLYVLCLMATPLLTLWYDDGRIAELWPVVSVMVLLTGLNAVPNAIAQRQQRFDLMTWLPLAATLLTAVIVVTAAQHYQSVWIIVLNVVGSALFGALLFWLFVRPKVAAPRGADIHHVFHFSKGVILSNFMAAIQRYADDIIVGRVLGAGAAGHYNFSYRMLQMPLRELGGIIDKLAYPRLASLAAERQKLSAAMGQIVFESTLLITPAALGIALLADDLIAAVFGPAWLVAAVPFQIFALLTIYQLPSARLGTIFLVTRRTGVMARWGVVSTPLIVISFIVGVQWGIAGVAASYALASLLLAYWRVRWAAGVMDSGVSFFWRNWLLAMAIGIALALPPLAVNLWLQSTDTGVIARLAIVLPLFAMTVFATYGYLMLRRRRVRPLW